MFFRKILGALGSGKSDTRASKSSLRSTCFPSDRRSLRVEPLEDRRMLSITLFVDADSTAPTPDGLAWSSAYPDLQSALEQAVIRSIDADVTNDIDQIWIAEGTYYPTVKLESSDVRSASFSLVDGVTFYGGFAGTETILSERDLSAHLTTLSGNLGTLDNNSDNAYTVVYCGESVEATLDGFFITDGNANGVNSSSHLEERYGGGIYNLGNIAVKNSTISDNLSGNLDPESGYPWGIVMGYGGYGAGIYNGSGVLTVMNSIFSNNVADGEGASGAFIIPSGYKSYGGGIYNSSGTLTVTNSTLSNNFAGLGGGIYSDSDVVVTLNNTIVAGNQASDREDLQCASSGAISGSHNLIGVGRSGQTLVDGVDGNLVGTLASPIDPRLSDWGQLGSGQWGYYLLSDSPAIDAGDNALAIDEDGLPLGEDLCGNARIDNATVDIGAIEFADFSNPAQIYVVTSLEETIGNDGVLTFLEAFQAANSNRPVGDAAAGSFMEQDTIQFDGQLFAEGVSRKILLDGGELTIVGDLKIEGPGADLLTFDAARQNRVFSVLPDARVALSGMAITGGFTDSNGAGIWNRGDLTVTSSTLFDNSADDYGGGIYNDDHLATLSVINCVVSNNMAEYGSGIYNCYGTLTVSNSTVTGNAGSLGDNGSGIYHKSFVYDNSTAYLGTTTLHNTIVAGNANTGDTTDVEFGYSSELPFVVVTSSVADLLSEAISGSHNLIGIADDQTLGNGIDGNVVGTASSPVDPMLSEWTQFDNGQWGYYLLPGSPAVDAGDNALAVDATGQPLAEDIYGNARIGNATVDIGAVEGTTLGSPARTYVITSLEDEIAEDGVLTFIEAFEAANRNQPIGDAQAGSFSEQDKIQFHSSLFAEGNVKTLLLDDGELVITSDLSIEGPGVDLLVFDAAMQNRVFSIKSNVTVNLSGMTITRGSTDSVGGGIYNDNSDLTLSDVRLVENSASRTGGGIYNNGMLTLSSSIVASNSSDASSGGGIYNDHKLVVTNSHIFGNSAKGHGGGIANGGWLTITNSTVTENSTDQDGGGISNSDGQIKISNSVIAANSAIGIGGGIWHHYGDLVVTNCTITDNLAGNSGGGIYDTSELTMNNSILWQNEGGELKESSDFSGVQNLIGINPQFVNPDAGDYRLQANSPAINYGDNSLAVDADDNPLEVDLAGNARVYGVAVDCGAFELQEDVSANRETPSLTVTTPNDVFDLEDHLISLREAIWYANPDSLGTAITFDASLDESIITLCGAALQIDKSLSIDASSLTSLTVDAAGHSRLFTFSTVLDEEVELKGLTLTGGSAYEGGGILNTGTLTLTDCTLMNNVATVRGGAIYNMGSLTVFNSTLLNNSVASSYYNYNGGGIYNADGTLTINNSTISNNSASLGGGIYSSGGVVTISGSTLSANPGDGIANYGTLTLTDSVISGHTDIGSTNGSGCGLSNWGPATIVNCRIQENAGIGIISFNTLTISNSTLSENVGSGIHNYSTLTVSNCTFTANQGGGIVGQETLTLNNSILWQNGGEELGLDEGYETSFYEGGSFSESQNLIGIDPRFIDPDAGDYRLQADSPAVNYGDNSLAVGADGNLLEVDLAGNARVYGAAVDCGAFELQEDIAAGREAPSLTVTTANDVFDLYDNKISLREAIWYADPDSLGTTITFDTALDESTITLCGASLWIDKSLTIDALPLMSLTVDADNNSRIFTLPTSLEEEVKLSGLTLTAGFAKYGGAIYNSGTLTLADSILSENSAKSGGGGIYNSGVLAITNTLVDKSAVNKDSLHNSSGLSGGGIHNDGLLTIFNSEISNSSANSGGGIYSQGALIIINSAITGNLASGRSSSNDNLGGGICCYNDYNYYYPTSTLTIINSTISNNTADDGGGIYAFGYITLNNTIVAKNTATLDRTDLYITSNSIFSGSHNLIGNGLGQTSLVHGTDGNLIGTSELPIDPKFVDPENGNYRLLPDSPAVDAGDDSLAVDLEEVPLEEDLAGHLRVQNGTVEIGAYEFGAIDWGTVRLNLRDRKDTKDLAWVDEWSGCWVEIWGRGDASSGIGDFDVELGYEAGCFVPDLNKVASGGEVDGDVLATVHEETGVVQISGTMSGDIAGQDADVLLAKVYFKPAPGESSLPRDTDGKYLEPVADAGFYVKHTELTQASTFDFCYAEVQQHDAVPLWPVMFDLNGDSVIDLVDVSQVMAVFQMTTSETAPPMAWASDFDRSGRVDLMDLSEILARFQWRKSDGSSVTYPDYFPYQETIGAVEAKVAALAGTRQSGVSGATVALSEAPIPVAMSIVPASISERQGLRCADTIFADRLWDDTDYYMSVAKDLTAEDEEGSIWQEEAMIDLDLNLFDDLR